MTDDEPMTEDDERAERIKKLRRGEPVARRERRKPRVPEPVEEVADPGDVNVDGSIDHDGPKQPDDDLALPDDAGAALTVASMYLTQDLRQMLERQEKHLHLRYGMQYDVDIYGPRHIRPLAL